MAEKTKTLNMAIDQIEREYGKGSIRNIRRDDVEQVKLMEKEKQISEDESKRQQEDVQKITDNLIEKVELLFSDKEKDILRV